MWKNSLWGRIVIGTVLVLLVLAVIRFGTKELLAVLVAAWSVLATLEFLDLLRKADVILNRWLLCLLNLLIVAAGYLGLLPGFLIAPVGVVFLAAVAARETRPRNPVYGTFTLVYLGFLPAHLVMLKGLAEEQGLSFWLVLFPLVLTWINDTAAYFTGKIAGQRRLAPTISPNKTLEGFVAGILAAAMLSAIGLRRLEPFSASPVWWLGFIGIGLGALAQAGDLFESIFKRAVGIKDTSNVLGQHGGFLDRIDSLLFTIPAFYYLVRLLC
ncbi:MAG: phosphatidate cytidylyltransferase [candidate division WOR-3 bacterium]